MDIFVQYLITFGWAITGAVSMAISLGILVKIFTILTPIDEWEEIKNGNLGVALILCAVILGGSLIVALTVMA